MQNLFKAVLNLPTITLSQEAWEQALKIISCLKRKDGYHFQKRIEMLPASHPIHLLTKKDINNISHYLDAWYTTSIILMGWYTILCLRWHKLTNHELSTDDLLPIIIAYLPNDISLQKQLNQQLALAAQIDTHRIGCITTHFYSAVCASLLPDKIETNDNIQTLIKNIESDQPLIELQLSCLFYKDELKNQIESHLSSFHCSKQHFNLKNLFIEDSTLLTRNPEIIILIEKYLFINDIKATLFRNKAETAKIMIEFEKKFEHYSQLLQMKNHNQQPTKPTDLKQQPKLTALNAAINIFMLPALHEDKNDDHLNAVITHFQAYKNEMLSIVKSVLSTCLYYKKGLTHLGEDNIFTEIHSDLTNKNHLVLFSEKNIFLLLKYYQYLEEMQQHLDQDRIGQFMDCYFKHYSELNTFQLMERYNNTDTSYFNLGGLYRLFTFHPEQSKETAFIRQATHAIDTMHSEKIAINQSG